MPISIDALVKRYETLKSSRAVWESHWQACSDRALPQKSEITAERTPGTRLNTELYDSTAVFGAQVFAAGMHSYLTNPSSRWFVLGIKNKAFSQSQNVKGWLKETEDIIYDHLNSSNFNQVIHEDYIDFSVVGNSTLYEEEDPEDVITFYVRPISEIHFLENNKGRIDTVYRYFSFTARQAFQQWGNNAGKKVMDLMEAGKVEDRVSFLHLVLPRSERDIGKRDARNMPFASLYIEPKTRKVLSEGGYFEFPYFIGRAYKISSSQYAYSSTSQALADIKTVNQMTKDVLEAAQKMLYPPIILPNDGYLLPFKTSPKAINYKLSANPDDKVEELQLKRDINITFEMIRERRQIIQRYYFVDLFLMLANLPDKNRTATEIAERVNERMLILGPLLGRLMKEKLDPVIERTFNILLRNGYIPPPPDELRGEAYKIEYISPLAKAQKAVEARSVSALVEAIRQMAEIDISAVDLMDTDKIVKRFAEIEYTSDLLRADREVQAIRGQRNKQAQLQQELEAMKQGGEGAQSMLKAEQMLTKPQGGETAK